MKTFFRGILTVGAGAILTAGTLAVVLLEAAPLHADPGTFWNLLGIPQGTQKMRDARANRLGNNPQRERVPPLKRIADPANLESKNPAIAAAAKVKKDQDLAPQKIKAIKYLGSIACCCPTNKEDIKNALLAALDDCTDEVRQAAATAICQASGNPCTICNDCSCCTADVMNKLNEMANEQDEKGCWKEPNPVVRQAASLALEACRRVRGPEPATEPVIQEQEQKERRVPTAPKDPAYQTPPAKPAPTKAPPKPATKAADAPAAEGDGWKVRPASAESSPAGFVEISDPINEPVAQPQPAVKPAQKSEPATKPAEPSAKPAPQKAAPANVSEPNPLPSASPAEPKLLIKFSAAD